MEPTVRAPSHSSHASDGVAGPRTETTALLGQLRDNISRVLLGKPEVVEAALVTLLAEGHLLIEDVPGIGKTLLAKALARSLDCTFHRIQFTPDLLPSDLLGTSVFHQPVGEFVFKPGPLFAQVVLADEINRATPRTQSALLEAMSERQISLDSQTHTLGPPFLVLATQNPYEFEGTYLLPESQLDRFLMRIRIGYPERAIEKQILTGHRSGEPVDRLKPVLPAAAVVQLQEQVRQVRVDDSLNDYILDIVEQTRRHPDLYVGASPRAALGLYRASQALAIIRGRDFVVPDDIKQLAGAVLGHRLLSRNFRPGEAADAAATLISEILTRTRVPV